MRKSDLEAFGRIVYVTPSLASFVRWDLEGLAKRYTVSLVFQDWSRVWMTPIKLLSQFVQLLWLVPKAKAIIVSFGGYWSLLPSIFGKVFNVPVYIIVHGTDACNFPEIGYGNLRLSLLRSFTKRSYELSTCQLPVSESLIKTVNSYFDPEHPKELGVLAEFPDLDSKFKVIPNGFDLNFWNRPDQKARTPNTFITVASESQFIRKGVDLIIEAAKELPSAKFYIVGANPSVLMDAPKNVVFTGRISQEELIDYYQASDFYFQLSVFEGFGCALCEAMLCGCIPIVSHVNILPSLANHNGLVLESRDSKELIRLIQRACELPDNLKEEIRQSGKEHIQKQYPLSNRIEQLIQIVQNGS